MTLRNKIKELIDREGITAYRFVKDTGFAPATGYRLAADPTYVPSAKILEAICDRYRVQPGEILEWVPKSDRIP
jgi:DNA-binding Xre family transcriptional regulator